MHEKIGQGWDFEKTYMYLYILDEIEKEQAHAEPMHQTQKGGEMQRH